MQIKVEAATRASQPAQQAIALQDISLSQMCLSQLDEAQSLTPEEHQGLQTASIQTLLGLLSSDPKVLHN